MLNSQPQGGRSQHRQPQQTDRSMTSSHDKQSIKVSNSTKMPATNEAQQKSKLGPSSGGKHHKGRANIASGLKCSKLKKFCLHSVEDESLTKIIDFVQQQSLGRQKACIVTVVSKSPINDSTREHLTRAILASSGDVSSKNHAYIEKLNYSKEVKPTLCDKSSIYEPQVFGHVDFDNGLVLLTVDSFMDTAKLLSLSEIMPKRSPKRLEGQLASSHPLLDMWPEWNQNLIKTLLLLFTMSHIVVFYNPEPSIDYNLVQTLTILESLRMKSMKRIGDLFETIASGQTFSQQWIRECRISCPLALFICDTRLLDSTVDESRLQQVQEALEERVYLLLKKFQLVSSVIKDQKSLLCLPERDAFVFLLRQSTSENGKRHERDTLVSYSKNLDDAGSLKVKEAEKSLKTLLISGQSSDTKMQLPNQEPEANQCQFHDQLVKFMRKHMSTIENEHSKQGPRQHASTAIMPRFDDFFNVLLRLKTLLFVISLDEDSPMLQEPSWPVRDERRFVDVYDLFNVDEQFSQKHCYKAKATAFEIYVRTLQTMARNETSHLESMKVALHYYKNQARGSSSMANQKLLEDECQRYWLEAGSMSRESSMKSRQIKQGSGQFSARMIASPKRQTPNNLEDEKDNNLTITRRPNGLIVTSCCDCGRESKLLIKPNDRKKKLERVDIYQIND